MEQEQAAVAAVAKAIEFQKKSNDVVQDYIAKIVAIESMENFTINDPTYKNFQENLKEARENLNGARKSLQEARDYRLWLRDSNRQLSGLQESLREFRELQEEMEEYIVNINILRLIRISNRS